MPPGQVGDLVLIVVGPVGLAQHDGGTHPERPARLAAVMAGVERLGLGTEDVELLAATAASTEALERVHDKSYLTGLERLSELGGGDLDADTYVTPDSWGAALDAAGAGIVAIDALRRGEGDAAFVAVRPPGHHARPRVGMGFCLLNNVAIAAAALRAAGERVAILDWDVHHGNGTQETFWDDPEVLYVSMHQWPLYPGTGRPTEVGGPNAPGTTLNVPLPPRATGDVVRAGLDDVVAPVIARFGATWLLVSAGFDAHRADPLADLGLSSGDFAELARTGSTLVEGPGRLVLFLEGGYNLTALERSVEGTLGALMGARSGPEAPTEGGPGRDVVAAAGRIYAEATDEAGS